MGDLAPAAVRAGEGAPVNTRAWRDRPGPDSCDDPLRTIGGGGERVNLVHGTSNRRAVHAGPGRRAAAAVALLVAAALAGCGGGEPGSRVERASALVPAYWLSTRVMSGGGSMTSPNMTNQTSVNGTITRSGYTADSYTVSATANVGYTISYVAVNGVNVVTGGTAWSGTIQAPTAGGTQSVTCSFTPTRYTITASAGQGGSVSAAPPATAYYGNQVAATFQPISGWAVRTITVTGASSYTCNAGPCTGPWATNASVRVVAVVAANVAMAATFTGPPQAQSAPGQTVPPGTLVTLDGSSSFGSPTSYTWTQTGTTPSLVTLLTNGMLATFVAPAAQGVYSFRLTVQPGGSAATTTVTVSTDPVGVAQTQCQNCHAGVGVGSSSNVFGKWSASQHAQRYVMCYGCHVGANTGGHPGVVGQSTVNASTFTWSFPTLGYAAGTSFCAMCHDTAAQIVTDFQASVHSSAPGAPGTCSGCHGDPHEAASGTAACVRCHVAAGAVAGHPFAVDGTAACTGCHNPHTTAAMPVGGHDKHLQAGIGCSTCHVAVIGVVQFDPAGPAWSASLPAPGFDAQAKTCSSVACHSVPAGSFDFSFPGGDGAPEPVRAPYGGSTTTPPWYSTSAGGCAACHDLSFQGQKYVWHGGAHAGVNMGGNNCQTCHPDATGTVTATGPGRDAALSTASTCGTSGRLPCASLHRNGVVDVTPQFRSVCFGCH
jgi:predicted CxxxxCH...CXXCH cytochrome family protein